MCGIVVLFAVLACQIPGDKPNIIVVLTDDQRWDTITPEIMPELNRRLIDHGILYTNAFITNPLCCPSRAAILSGGYYSHETQILTNSFENGSAARFVDTKTIAVLAQQQGYATCFVGKYLNFLEEVTGISPDGQPIEKRHYTPPAWDLFESEISARLWYKYKFIFGSSQTDGPQRGLFLPLEVNDLPGFLNRPEFRSRIQQYFGELNFGNLPYIAHFHKDVATNFILDAADNNQPFLVFIASRAPHAPATPEPQYENLFPGFEYRDRGWGEEDLDDKPYYVRKRAEYFENAYEGEDNFDDFTANQLRTLRSIDDMIASLSDLIDSDERLRNTWFFFLSDNGYLWGEHKIFRKSLPYEESIRVPLVVQSPDRNAGINNGIVAADLDVGATIVSLIGYDPKDLSQGHILSLDNSYKKIMFESWRTYASSDRPSWSSIRTARWKYVHNDTGEEELYNLVKDTFELSNIASSKSKLTNKFYEMLKHRRGLCILGEDNNESWEIPFAVAGQYYEHTINAIGGIPPYEWVLITDERYIENPWDEYIDRLPLGLSLGSDGIIYGVPAEIGKFEFVFEVTDQSDTLYRGGSQRHATSMRLVVE